MKVNTLLLTDVYKMGHMEQYPKGTNKIYSYLHTRSDRKYNEIVVYGLQALLKKYLIAPIEYNEIEFFIYYREQILGSYSKEVSEKMNALYKLGYFPLEIKSFREGTILPAKSVIATITNTIPEFYWVVGFFESLLLHLWYPMTVASASRQYYKLVENYAKLTCDDLNHLPYSVHDFGYRGCSSEESAAIAGSAHLLNFLGTDTIPALDFIYKYYYPRHDRTIACSVPASEHSVMCSFGKENEIDAFENMLNIYPEGIVSIVSDTYDIYALIHKVGAKLKDKILSRNGKVVFRPDSGNPSDILCGDKSVPIGSSAYIGIFELLEKIFGSSINSKGYKVLNPKIGVIYGDGMYYDNFKEILERMKQNGWASSNLVIGVGGILLQNHSRDDLGFSFKATYIEVDGKPRNLMKSPITDPYKKSLTGLISCHKDEEGKYIFKDNQSWEQENKSLLETIYKDGKLIVSESWPTIKERIRENHEICV